MRLSAEEEANFAKQMLAQEEKAKTEALTKASNAEADKI